LYTFLEMIPQDWQQAWRKDLLARTLVIWPLLPQGSENLAELAWMDRKREFASEVAQRAALMSFVPQFAPILLPGCSRRWYKKAFGLPESRVEEV
jgi:hypothetical protein